MKTAKNLLITCPDLPDDFNPHNPDAIEAFAEAFREWKQEATVAVSAAERLEYLRGEIRAERISYGEIAELESLAEYIDPSDVELLQWAGVPET